MTRDMRHQTEFIINNPYLLAAVAWQVSRSYHDATGNASAPEIPTLVVSLGILLHRPSVKTIRAMQSRSGILKALSDNPYVRVGLQERMEGSAEAILDGINVGMAAGLMKIDYTGDSWPRVFPAPSPKNLPAALQPTGERGRDMLKAAKRLGSWFSSFDVWTIAETLMVRV